MSRQFTFDCPECDVEMDVDAPIRSEMLEDGCVLCETAVSADAFYHLTRSDGTR